MSQKTTHQALNEALREEMLRDENVYIIGEDVAAWGGAYSVTKGLLEEFGPDRAIDTPISENLIACMSIGMALMGMRPVTEIMFADLSSLWFDAIANEAAKMRFVSNGAAACPIVFRAAQGSGGGSASQHSQVIESWFMNIPGLVIMSPSTAYDAKGMLKSAIRYDGPVLFLESKRLYGDKAEVPEEEYLIPIGKGKIVQEGKDVTLIASQRMLKFGMEAASRAAEKGVSVEVIDPLTIKPYDAELFCASAKKTGRVLISHECCKTGGYAAEFAFCIQENCFASLKKPIRRVASLDSSIPAGPLDMFVMPDAEEIYAGIMDLVK